MPVDISKIPERAKKITNPLTPVTNEYDSLWGFYTFSQTVQYDYDDIGKTGLSYATITINGFFTINAEVTDKDELSSMTDKEKSDKLFSKYKALRCVLLDKVGKKQPSKLSYIGTINDSRCIKLPSKLVDNENNYIYAIPNAFATTEISPEILKYTVTLIEPKKVPCKLVIESDIIDGASLSIICRRPRVTYRNFAFANGSEAYITGIDNRRYSLSGSICGLGNNIKYKDFVNIYSSNSSSDDSTSASTGMSVSAVNVISKIINKDKGRVFIKIQKTSDDKPENAFAMIVTSHNIGYGLDSGVMNIDISGEECSNSGSGSGGL
jgi:hypothetical protein